MASNDDVVINGSEIHDSRWISGREAVSGHEQGQLGMLPPTHLRGERWHYTYENVAAEFPPFIHLSIYPILRPIY